MATTLRVNANKAQLQGGCEAKKWSDVYESRVGDSLIMTLT